MNVRPDKVTTLERNALQANPGEVVFNTDTSENEYWNGSTWIAILSSDSINQSTNLYSQGYYGLLSGVYFGVTDLGSELVQNGDFATDSDWTKGAGITISGGKANSSGTIGAYGALITNTGTAVEIGKTYLVSYEISNRTQDGLSIRIGGAIGIERTANGIYTESITATLNTSIYFQSRGATGKFIGSIDNVSVKEVLANGTSSEIAIEDVDVWQDVVMTIQAPVDGLHLGGVADERVTTMKEANAVGHSGTGAEGDPIVFLLEGLKESSYCTLRASLTFEPDEDGGRLDSRIFLERHSAALPSEDFSINSAGLAMESGANEEYPHLVSVQFFIGDTLNTNGVGDAGKVRFQIKSDVAGTVSMNEMALFIQK